MTKKALAVLIAFAVFAGTTVAARTLTANWTPVSTWHIADAPASVELFKRQLGTNCCDTVNDTAPVTVRVLTGPIVTSHSSTWETIDTTQYGVPATATAVRLQIKGVITSTASPTVYVFVRKLGSTICGGPPGFEDRPIDFSWAGEEGDGEVKCWGVHAAINGRNGVREFNNVEVPLVDGKFELAWGYRRKLGIWPTGDAVAAVVWLNAWAD